LKAAKSLRGTAASIRIVRLPHLAEGGDVSDWLDADPSRGDKLVEVCLGAKEWQPSGEAGPAEQPEQKEQEAARKPKQQGADDLMSMQFQPLKGVIDGYLHPGFTVLAGRQKLGKTWMALDFALAVATGGTAMGKIGCRPGNVLYIDMENGPRRMQGRIKTLYGGATVPSLSRLRFGWEAPAINAGLIEYLDEWRTSVEDPRLALIDVLQRVKPAGNKHQNAYESDYSIFAPLQSWATRYNIAVVGLHHLKKGGADDPLEAVSGSNGLSACADTTIVLNYVNGTRTLYVRGRDIEEDEKAVLFTNGGFTLLGDAEQVRRSDQRNVIINTISENREPMKRSDIVSVTGFKSAAVGNLLMKMIRDGELFKATGHCYWIKPEEKR
jgi:hypothetical protein